MFPLRDDNPQLNTPIATYCIIAINVVSWFYLQGMGADSALQHSICHYGLIPVSLWGDSVGTMCDSDPGFVGVITSMFMHASWMHIIGNMWFLWVFGDNVEDSMGTFRFVLFYLLSGLCAAFAQVIVDPDSSIPMVGASGAIGGVMGAYIMLYPRVKVHMFIIFIVIFTTFRIPAAALLCYWAVVQLLGAISSIGATGGGVAFWAHIGGFVGGAVLVWLFKNDELLRNHPYYGWRKHD